MRKIVYILFGACMMLVYSCAKDVGIGAPLEVEPDYFLPQNGASQAANARIQKLYDDYGSYFIYEFTQKDFIWTPSAGTSNSRVDTAVMGNPMYVDEMLDFLDEIWIKHLPDAFKKGMGLPYRVLLADEIKQRRAGTGYPPGMEYLYYDFRVVGKSITIAGLNETLRTMTPAEKLAKKNALITEIFTNYYRSHGIIAFPEEFYAVSDYVNRPTMPVHTTTPATPPPPENVEAYRERGFIPTTLNTYTGRLNEWLTNDYAWTQARTNDLNSYITYLLQRTDAEIAPYLVYPKIKQKFDILVDHFKNEYGIDVRGIANATFE